MAGCDFVIKNVKCESIFYFFINFMNNNWLRRCELISGHILTSNILEKFHTDFSQ